VNGTSEMQDEKAMWYENFKPIKEYLNREFSKRPIVIKKDPKTVRFSWSEIMKKSSTTN
jgi:hypothetical protein